MGVKQIFVDDLREEFVRAFVFPMFRANTHTRFTKASISWAPPSRAH